ncbi:hypothetical protein D9M72_338120 [compost metagenome]
MIGKLVERKSAPHHDLDGAGKRIGVARKEPRHFLGRLQVAVGVPLTAETGLIDGDVVSYASNDILQDAPLRRMKQHVVGDDRRHADRRCQVGKLVKTQLVIRPAAERQRQVGAIAERLPQTTQLPRAVLLSGIGNEDRNQAFAIGNEIGPVEPAFRLAAAFLAE